VLGIRAKGPAEQRVNLGVFRGVGSRSAAPCRSVYGLGQASMLVFYMLSPRCSQIAEEPRFRQTNTGGSRLPQAGSGRTVAGLRREIRRMVREEQSRRLWT
jgi:hypothetical protein